MNTGMIIDIVVVAVFVIYAVMGMRKGLMRVFFGIVSFVLSGAAVVALTAPVSAYMMQTQVPELVRTHVQPPIEAVFERAHGAATIEETLEKAGMPDFVIDFVEKRTDEKALANSFVETMTNSAVSNIVTIFSMLVIFVGIHIVLTIIICIVGGILKTPVLGSFNRMLGGVVGVMNAMAIVYLLCAMVVLLSPVMDLSAVTDVINKTFITKCFYNNNILMAILS